MRVPMLCCSRDISKCRSFCRTIALWIVNTYSEFQVIMFSNNRNTTKYQSFLHNDHKPTDDATAIAIPQVFSAVLKIKDIKKK